MRRAKFSALTVLAVIALIVVEVLSAGSNRGVERPAPPLPPGVLQPPRATLAALRGKPALVNFWASWCGPCRKEAPELERFDRSLHGAARLVGVDYTDREDAGRSYIRQYGWTFPVLSDPNGVYGTRYGLIGLPTTAVLNSQGRIVEILHGPQTLTSLRVAIEGLRG